MLATKDPIAVPMPNLCLSESEIAAVLSFLEAQGRAVPDQSR